ncbi:nitrate- and nitrite sensing domain-containing protein [Kalamiella sp. sgz302252]|uniref:nitrate- and nitrite sensing domain-containing protein n=1 Tax=Pantoea sp. sgz302252 TaxID=3341827 RepID=UPI0036D3679A
MHAAISWLQASRQCEIAELKNLLQTGELTVALSRLIHELQRERGTSNVWLCSQGALFGEELPERERQVAAASELAFASFPPLPRPGEAVSGQSRLCNRIAAALYGLETLPALRRQIRSFQLSHAEAMACFSQIIRQLLNLGFATIDSACDPVVARTLVAMFSFMQGKELAGQERALGSAGYASGAFSQAQSEEIGALVAAQERCFASFRRFADAEALRGWQALEAENGEIERLRRIACTRGTPDAAGTEMALRWYALMTQRIDRLKILEDQLVQQLMARCRESIRLAEQAEIGQDTLEQALSGGDNDPAWSIYLEGKDALRQEMQALETDGLTPQLGRFVLGLVQEQSRRLQAQDDELAAMRATLEDRKQIDRAKALLMRHQGFSEEQAWQSLRKMAMDQNRRMVDIANALLSVAAVFPTTPK